MLGHSADDTEPLIEIFQTTERIRSVCGLKDGVKKINARDWSASDLALLAADMKADRATSALRRLNLLGQSVYDTQSVIEVFHATEHIHSVCGLEDGIKEIDSGMINSDRFGVPTQSYLAMLIEDMKADRATSRVKEIDFTSVTALAAPELLDALLPFLPASLRSLSLSQTELTEESLGPLSSWLPRLTNLRSLDLTGNTELLEWRKHTFSKDSFEPKEAVKTKLDHAVVSACKIKWSDKKIDDQIHDAEG